MNLLQNKTCIITGASRGIGFAIAKLFYENGANIAIGSRDNIALENAVKQISPTGERVIFLPLDVSEQEQCEALTDHCLKNFGTIDVLINCAGIITREDTLSLSRGSWQRVIDTNLNGSFFMSQLALQTMNEKQTGNIINIASQMAHMPHPGAALSYECSKAAMVALTRHIAKEFGPKGIRANAISPGSIQTGLQQDMQPAVWEAIKSNIPLARLGTVEEAANTALFLASDLSSYTTGAVLYVTGGSLMN